MKIVNSNAAENSARLTAQLQAIADKQAAKSVAVVAAKVGGRNV